MAEDGSEFFVHGSRDSELIGPVEDRIAGPFDTLTDAKVDLVKNEFDYDITGDVWRKSVDEEKYEEQRLEHERMKEVEQAVARDPKLAELPLEDLLAEVQRRRHARLTQQMDALRRELDKEFGDAD
jgi:hypothetical protein